MRPNTFAPHELLDLHELLPAEVTTAEKLQVSIEKVNDNELKSFMQTCLTAKQNRIAQMSQIVANATGTAIQ
jgi:5-hydroxyisourate hydrolase-like protein (transthyretin family)